MEKPIVDLELNPGRRQHIQRLDRLEVIPCQEHPADLARRRIHERVQSRHHSLERNQAAEARIHAAHGRVGEVIGVQVIPRPHEDLGSVLPVAGKKQSAQPASIG